MEPNNAAQIINRRPSARTACLIAVACLIILAANFSYAAFAQARVIRVTAADIAKLTARQNYVVDLRQSGVAYDLDGRERAIDWNRVRIRKAAGEMALLTYLRERFPKMAGTTPTRLVIGATGGIVQIKELADAPDDSTEHKCFEDNTCECSGARDCKKMLKAGVCVNDEAACGLADDGHFYCQCGKK